MATRVIQQKLVGETLVVETDMVDRLVSGETIATVASSIQVWSGTDPAAVSVLVGAPTHTGTVISQEVTGGLPGVIYKILLSANTSDGNLLINEVKLAVLDTNAGNA